MHAKRTSSSRGTWRLSNTAVATAQHSSFSSLAPLEEVAVVDDDDECGLALLPLASASPGGAADGNERVLHSLPELRPGTSSMPSRAPTRNAALRTTTTTGGGGSVQQSSASPSADPHQPQYNVSTGVLLRSSAAATARGPEVRHPQETSSPLVGGRHAVTLSRGGGGGERNVITGDESKLAVGSGAHSNTARRGTGGGAGATAALSSSHPVPHQPSSSSPRPQSQVSSWLSRSTAPSRSALPVHMSEDAANQPYHGVSPLPQHSRSGTANATLGRVPAPPTPRGVPRTPAETVEEVRQSAAKVSTSVPRFLPLTAKDALQSLQQAIRALVTHRGALEIGSVPTLLLTTYNIVCKQLMLDEGDSHHLVLAEDAAFASQPRSLFDTFAHGKDDTTIATELRDLQRELLLTKKHYHVAIQQVDILKHRLHEHVAEIRRLEKMLDQAATLELDLRSNAAQLQATITKRDVEIAELKSNLVSLHSSLQDSQSKDHVRIAERTSDLRQELVALYDQVRQNDEMSKSFEREINNLHADAKRNDERLEEAYRDLEQTQRLLTTREDELYQARNEVTALEAKVTHQKQTIEDLEVVQGDTMIQDKMIREKADWGRYKEFVTSARRDLKTDSHTLPINLKSTRAFGVNAAVVPAWLRAEGKVKPKLLYRADTIHIALQALTDLSLPASITTNLKALLQQANSAVASATAAAAAATTGPFTSPGGGQRTSLNGAKRDDAILSSIGAPIGRRSMSTSVGFGGVSAAPSAPPQGQDCFLVDLANRLPFSDSFKLWLSRSGTDVLNNKQGTELAYGFYHSLCRWPSDPDLVLFDAILRGDVPQELHYHVFSCFDEMLDAFVKADEDMYGGEARRAIPITTVGRVLQSLMRHPHFYATPQDAEQLLFLLTMDFNVPYIPYRSLLEYDDDGDRNYFLQAFMRLVVARSVEYYDTLQHIIENLARASLSGTSTPRRRKKGTDPSQALSQSAAPQGGNGSSGPSQTPGYAGLPNGSTIDRGGDSDDDDEDEDDVDDIVSDENHEDAFNYPGEGHSRKPIPPSLRTVEVSLTAFAHKWIEEDPFKRTDMPDLVSLIRMTVAAKDAAEKKRAADAEAAAAAAANARGGRNRSLASQRIAPTAIAPSLAVPFTPASLSRDLFSVETLVAALRSLVLTRSSHRAYLTAEEVERGCKTGADAAKQNASTAPADLLMSPEKSTTYLSSDFMTPTVALVNIGDSFHSAVRPPTMFENDAVGGGGGYGFADRLDNSSMLRTFGAHPPPTVALPPALMGSASGAINGNSAVFEVDWAAVPPAADVAPRFSLEREIDALDRDAHAKLGGGGFRRATSTSSLTAALHGTQASAATQSILGGGYGIPQSRAALLALGKRSQTALPPFFKVRMMKH